MTRTAAAMAKAAPAPQTSHRLVSAGVEEVLERFSDPDLLGSGKANVISLEAVQERFGPRWELRRDQVYGFTERALERGVGANGFFTRVSPTDFFIVHPDLSGNAGHAACLRYLREVLNHFLGEDEMAATGVLRVTGIVDGRLETRQMHDDLDPGVCVGAPDEVADAVPKPQRDAPGSPQSWSPFVAADGRRLRVSARLEPVYELRGFTRIGFRMIRRVTLMLTGEDLTAQQIAMLSTADLLRVDLATVSRGIDRLRSENGGDRQLSLIVPMSFASLSSQVGRIELVRQLKQAQRLVKLGVICEICDIDGVPPGALLAATSLLRPFVLLLVGRVLSTSPAAISRLSGTGLQAVSFDCPPALTEAAFAGWAGTAVAAAKRVAKSVLVYRAGSTQVAATLASLGASHVSILAAQDAT